MIVVNKSLNGENRLKVFLKFWTRYNKNVCYNGCRKIRKKLITWIIYSITKFFGEAIKGSYEVKIPRNVVDLKLIETENGILLKYITEFDKKREWAFEIMDKNSRSIERSYFNEELGVSFVLLSDGRFGFSRCSKDDKFVPVIGRAVAVCHATGEKVPDFI